MPGLSTIVSNAVLGVPRMALPVGELSVKFTVSLPSMSVSAARGTVKLLGVVSPGPQVSTPVTGV